MTFRVVDIVRDGLSAKVLAGVAAAVVADLVAILAMRGVKLGPEVELAVVTLVTAALVGVVGYVVPEKTEV